MSSAAANLDLMVFSDAFVNHSEIDHMFNALARKLGFVPRTQVLPEEEINMRPLIRNFPRNAVLYVQDGSERLYSRYDSVLKLSGKRSDLRIVCQQDITNTGGFKDAIAYERYLKLKEFAPSPEREISITHKSVSEFFSRSNIKRDDYNHYLHYLIKLKELRGIR